MSDPDETLIARYADALLSLFPPGRALTRAAGSGIRRLSEALSVELARIHEAGDQLPREAFPGTADVTMPLWERGLLRPEDSRPATLAARQALAVSRLHGLGTGTEAAFIAAADALGHAIELEHHQPFEVGRSAVGDALYGDEWMHTLLVHYSDQEPYPPPAPLRRALERLRRAHGHLLYAPDLSSGPPSLPPPPDPETRTNPLTGLSFWGVAEDIVLDSYGTGILAWPKRAGVIGYFSSPGSDYLATPITIDGRPGADLYNQSHYGTAPVPGVYGIRSEESGKYPGPYMDAAHLLGPHVSPSWYIALVLRFREPYNPGRRLVWNYVNASYTESPLAIEVSASGHLIARDAGTRAAVPTAPTADLGPPPRDRWCLLEWWTGGGTEYLCIDRAPPVTLPVPTTVTDDYWSQWLTLGAGFGLGGNRMPNVVIGELAFAANANQSGGGAAAYRQDLAAVFRRSEWLV
ncbi:MAG: DUF2313 domain-containing protein [Myxococcales bacterium]|nr:DUF2313 domain-containing protein [Myxococcales bacterium]